MTKYQVLVLLLIFVGIATSATEVADSRPRFKSECRAILNGYSYDEAVIGSLKELLNDKVIALPDLWAILAGVNPLPTQTTAQAHEYQPVVDQIIIAIRNNREHLELSVKKMAEEARWNLVERNDSNSKTKGSYVGLTFYPIEAGELKGQIIERFWIANFPVTQWQYTMVMGSNPSWHRGNDPIEVEVIRAGQRVNERILMQPNHPVEQLLDNPEINYENLFILRLNELSKLNNPVIYKIIPGHVPNSLYRMPTSKEWEFVVRNRGAWTGPYPQGIDETNIGRFAWYNGNSDRVTHPVGKLEPILIDGKYPIYDLLGNVWEHTERDFLTSLRGGSAFTEPNCLRSDCRNRQVAARFNFDIGLRLVMVPPP